MKAGRWMIAVVAALLFGCAPGQGPQSELARTPAAAANPRFATELAGPSTYLAPMPTAVVLLKPDDLNRNRAFCNAFTSRLPTAQEARAASIVAPNLILTRWMVQMEDVPPERARDCDYLVGTYDYARASRLISGLRLTAGRFSGPGPFLLMIIPDATGLHVAGLDGSTFTAVDFGRFLDSWGGALGQTEALVSSRAPEQPGLVRSVFTAIAAILRTVAVIPAAIILGVAGNL